MIYLYDVTRIDDLKEQFSNFEIIDFSRILPFDMSNLVDLEKIYYEMEDPARYIIDLSSLMYSNEFQRQFIGRILSEIKRVFSSSIFLLQDHLFENLIKELPFIFEGIEINENLIVQDIDSEKENNCELNLDFNIQFAVNKLIGHDKFKDDFINKYQNFILLENIGVRKIFSIFLIGESGIGKTEFAKILSKSLYPKEELIKINFGNYSTEGVLNSLIGSPLGYIGSNEGGELIKKIKSSKSKIILIDEFEKATPSVFNFFYELLEDGKFTDRHGNAHNLRGYTIVFTSNMSTDYFFNYIPAPLRSRFDLLSDFQIPSIQEKQLFIQNQTEKLINKLNSIQNNSYKIGDDLKVELMNFAKENNLRQIKRMVQDAIAEDYRIKNLS